MKQILILAITTIILPKYNLLCNEIRPINQTIKTLMINGNTWKKNCPVNLKDLRYLKIEYLGFDNKSHIGELIVHKNVAKEVSKIFKKLKAIKYPIYQMKLASYYKGNDKISMKNNNTSAFNCRLMTGSKIKWSKHSYGKAIDINPIQNPYIKKNKVLPKEGTKYINLNRKHFTSQSNDKAIIIKNDKIIKIFKNYGWIWGGNWTNLKD